MTTVGRNSIQDESKQIEQYNKAKEFLDVDEDIDPCFPVEGQLITTTEKNLDKALKIAAGLINEHT